MDLLEIFKSINEDWKLMVFVFGAGAAWYQGKAWFKKLTETLESVARHNTEHNTTLTDINEKLGSLDKRVARIEGKVELIQDENHDQDVKIAVLESTRVSSRR